MPIFPNPIFPNPSLSLSTTPVGAYADAVHQAVGDVGLARDAIAGLSAANEHTGDVARKNTRRGQAYKILWHYISLSEANFNADKGLQRSRTQNQGNGDKVGLDVSGGTVPRAAGVGYAKASQRRGLAADRKGKPAGVRHG